MHKLANQRVLAISHTLLPTGVGNGSRETKRFQWDFHPTILVIHSTDYYPLSFSSQIGQCATFMVVESREKYDKNTTSICVMEISPRHPIEHPHKHSFQANDYSYSFCYGMECETHFAVSFGAKEWHTATEQLVSKVSQVDVFIAQQCPKRLIKIRKQ